LVSVVTGMKLRPCLFAFIPGVGVVRVPCTGARGF